eukprot:GHVQ01008336.1.p1 GENE.GHVQ01008336.1~~GHVQ01008336.1.p1  ORF type:complete len:1034 (+),score=228.01 GHVQ01008336.1:46-3147(+)
MPSSRMPDAECEEFVQALKYCYGKEVIVHFVRHGEAEHNVAARNRPPGVSRESVFSSPRLHDPPLTPHGITQCQQLLNSNNPLLTITPKDGGGWGNKMGGSVCRGVDIIICSPLTRCIQSLQHGFLMGWEDWRGQGSVWREGERGCGRDVRVMECVRETGGGGHVCDARRRQSELMKLWGGSQGSERFVFDLYSEEDPIVVNGPRETATQVEQRVTELLSYIITTAATHFINHHTHTHKHTDSHKPTTTNNSANTHSFTHRSNHPLLHPGDDGLVEGSGDGMKSDGCMSERSQYPPTLLPSSPYSCTSSSPPSPPSLLQSPSASSDTNNKLQPCTLSPYPTPRHTHTADDKNTLSFLVVSHSSFIRHTLSFLGVLTPPERGLMNCGWASLSVDMSNAATLLLFADPGAVSTALRAKLKERSPWICNVGDGENKGMASGEVGQHDGWQKEERNGEGGDCGERRERGGVCEGGRGDGCVGGKGAERSGVLFKLREAWGNSCRWRDGEGRMGCRGDGRCSKRRETGCVEGDDCVRSHVCDNGNSISSLRGTPCLTGRVCHGDRKCEESCKHSNSKEYSGSCDSSRTCCEDTGMYGCSPISCMADDTSRCCNSTNTVVTTTPECTSTRNCGGCCVSNNCMISSFHKYRNSLDFMSYRYDSLDITFPLDGRVAYNETQLVTPCHGDSATTESSCGGIMSNSDVPTDGVCRYRSSTPECSSAAVVSPAPTCATTGAAATAAIPVQVVTATEASRITAGAPRVLPSVNIPTEAHGDHRHATAIHSSCYCPRIIHLPSLESILVFSPLYPFSLLLFPPPTSSVSHIVPKDHHNTHTDSQSTDTPPLLDLTRNSQHQQTASTGSSKTAVTVDTILQWIHQMNSSYSSRLLRPNSATTSSSSSRQLCGSDPCMPLAGGIINRVRTVDRGGWEQVWDRVGRDADEGGGGVCVSNATSCLRRVCVWESGTEGGQLKENKGLPSQWEVVAKELVHRQVCVLLCLDEAVAPSEFQQVSTALREAGADAVFFVTTQTPTESSGTLSVS